MSSSEGGSTGRRTDWSCRIKIAVQVKLLRPSVQLPAGIHGWRGYTDFDPNGKQKAGYSVRFCEGRNRLFAALLDRAGPAGVFRRNFCDFAILEGRG